MSKILVLATIIFLALINPTFVSASTYVANESASLGGRVMEGADVDFRVIILKNYFAKHGSPLSEVASEFVEKADEYSLDWRLVPAITGVESTYGKRIPQNSFNAYGWANGDYEFASWENSIEVVSRSLREKYLDKGATNIDQIARRYAPPSNTWATKVKFIMKRIDKLPLSFTISS